ncbi:MAG: TIGR03546 family protein [Elusimicrobiota bacterium]
MGLSLLKDIVSILRGQQSPRATAAGFAVGAMLGLVPKGNLLGLIFFLLFFLTTVNKAAALLAAALFTPIGFALDPLAHRIGQALLGSDGLRPLWTALYNLPVIPWTQFNNTAVLGQLVLGLAFFAPLYFMGKKSVAWYKERLAARVEKLKIVQALKAFKIYQWYERISG